MKHLSNILLGILLLFLVVACTPEQLEPIDEDPIIYQITINTNAETIFEIGDEIDFTNFFIITDNKGNLIPVTIEMIDFSEVNIDEAGTYSVSITFNDLSKEINITVINPDLGPTFILDWNHSLELVVMLFDRTVDYKQFFIIKDSNNQNIEVKDEYLDLSKLNIDLPGVYEISISFQGQSLTIQITVLEPDEMFATDLFISEYSEGSSQNKYIEIFNGTGQDINLADYSVKLFNNAQAEAQYVLQLSGILKDGDTYVIYHGSANNTIKANGDLANVVVSFNGNDPIALFKNNQLIDVVGDLNQQVSEGYKIGSNLTATKDNTIIRKPNVYGPNATWTESEWLVLGFEKYDNLKQHNMLYYKPPKGEEPEEPQMDLFISEYFEGSLTYETTKYIEIYNPFDHAVDLSNYDLAVYQNGSLDSVLIYNLEGMIASNEALVFYAPNSNQDIKDIGYASSAALNFTGKDAIALLKNDEVIDVFGKIDQTPGENGWIVKSTYGTVDHVYTRNMQVTQPTSTFNPTEWDLQFENSYKNAGIHFTHLYDVVIDDFDLLMTLIMNLPIDNKGTAISTQAITIRGTVFMDVENETTLVYITDGKNFIKLHGDKIHNYTSLNTVYEVQGYYQSYIYQPTFDVINPNTDIKSLGTSTLDTIYYKEVSLQDVLNLKREELVKNIYNGYLQSMLKVTGYLHLDTHNSTRSDYALTINQTYIKNDTQYINNGLYFKNDVEDLEEFLIDYEVEAGKYALTVDIFGVIYDWNPNRKNWRLYVSDELTFKYLNQA
ncbi:lamin tail domain-containing protein [Acholeplasma equirhinis]|uniref:lamin tail domain-containing protein n=1 Tax=Acholeplasma equirhinis TaxID=555393 RepID=UPI00197AA060|nr:lamin tail domain-containing protein [Acholeplasma equirhinis]MBN3490146.1 lamin tail domain-containing protein [Acholeplasma equirhinis]